MCLLNYRPILAVRSSLDDMEDFKIGDRARFLCLAAARGDIKKVKNILSQSRSNEVSYDFYALPLRLAAQYGQAEVAALLRPKIADMSGKRLIKAAKHGRSNEVQALLVMGVDASSKTKSNWTALHYAAKFGHLSTVKRLLAKGAQVNLRGTGGQTPLFEAAFYGNIEMTKILVDNGANVNVRGYGRMTPVQAAFSNGYHDVANNLINKGGF